MKTIFRVAKTELRTLFYSPIAWFLMIVFLIQCGIVYLGQIESAARTQEMGGMGLMYMNTLTERVFLSSRGLFGSVMQNLYLYIPLLTMSLISRETSSGTIKLLYSSPIRVSEIVFGKYLAMMVYSLLLVVIVGIFVVSGTIQVQHPDTGMLMTAMLGFYLLLCAYSAIGLFMSCLTTYQVVAAVCTFVMIGILSYIGTLWQNIAFVRELTYFLSINGRTQKMLAGLLISKDVIYFVVIVYIFLGLSIFKLKAGMESKPTLVKVARYVAIVVSALLIGYVSSVPALTGYYDATANKTRTLTPQVQKILAELGDDPLEVTAYNNLLGRYWYFGNEESYNQNIARWEIYTRFKTNIELKTVCYYDTPLDNPYLEKGYPGKSVKEIAEQYSKSNNVKLKELLTPEQIHKMINLTPELNRYVMKLKWKDRTTYLRVFDDMQMWPGETEVAAALKRLQQVKLPRIAFLTGDLERNIDKLGDREFKALTNLSTFRYSLINQGFDVCTVALDTQDIPSDIATLVVADPKAELSAGTMAKLQQYIDKGGNLLICGEPGKQAILNPLLQQMGVQLMAGTLIQESKEFAPNLVTPDLTKVSAMFTKALGKSAADSQKVSMPGVAGLSYTTGGAYTIQPLLMTDSALTWNRVKPLDLDMMTSASAADNAAPVPGSVTMTSVNGPVTRVTVGKKDGSVTSGNDQGSLEERRKKAMMMAKAGKTNVITHTTAPVKKVPEDVQVTPTSGGYAMAVSTSGSSSGERRSAAAGIVAFSAADGDVKGPIATALSLTRKVNGKEQRIVVTGDADFMSNVELQRFNMKTANFIFNTALFSWLCYGEFPIDTSRPDAMDKRVNVTMDQVDYLRIMYIWVLPGILLAFGTVLLIRRTRK